MKTFKPRPYQERLIVDALSQAQIQFNVDMGLGKTITVLKIFETLIMLGEIRKPLVIAPKKVAEITWPEQIEEWGVPLTYSLVLGSEAQRLKALATKADIYIVNHENVVWLTKALDRWPFDMVVVDESSKMKSHASQRFKALKRHVHGTSRWINMTGTPMPQGLSDLWSQMFLLDRGERLGKNITAFRNRWLRKKEYGYGWELLPHAEEEVQSLIADLCVTMMKEDYIDLPELMHHTLHVDLPFAARETYRELEKDMLTTIEAEEVVAANAAALSGKCLQLANGAVYHDDERNYVEAHSEKLDRLVEVIEEADGPVLVAYNFRSDLERMLVRLKGYKPQVLTKDNVRDWNRSRIRVLLAHPASCGHGLNLQHGGHTLVWFGLNWALELYEQMNARLHRPGQEKPVQIYHIVCRDTVDEAVMDRLHQKSSAQQALLNCLKRKSNA